MKLLNKSEASIQIKNEDKSGKANPIRTIEPNSIFDVLNEEDGLYLLKLYPDNIVLLDDNTELKTENESLKAEILELKAEIELLKTKSKNTRNKAVVPEVETPVEEIAETPVAE